MPGTPADRPLNLASLKGSGAPFSMKESGCIAACAFSRASIVVTLPLVVRMTMKPPPPMPAEKGSVTPRTPAAATAASTAFPPRLSTSTAAAVASTSTVAAAPPRPIAVGSLTGSGERLCFAVAAAGTASSATASATASGRLEIRPMCSPCVSVSRVAYPDSC